MKAIKKKENKTGNNVGKTTVLKLINYCLGGNEKEIYKSSESDSKENKKIKEFLTNKNVNLKLILYKNLDNPNDEIVIERNFSNKYIVNGNNVKNKNKLEELSQELLPDFIKDKMSIRSIIHYYIRYTNISTQNTLKILEKFSDNQYEPIFLTFLGISPENLKDKKQIDKKIKENNNFIKKVLEKGKLDLYKSDLNKINEEIKDLNKNRNIFIYKPNFEENIKKLNEIKLKLFEKIKEKSKLDLDLKIIKEAEYQLKKGIKNIDTNSVKLLYEEAMEYSENLNKNWDEFLEYHEKMVAQKVQYITKNIPEINKKIEILDNDIFHLREKQKNITEENFPKNSLQNLEDIIFKLNEKHEEKGKYEKIISLVEEKNKENDEHSKKLNDINSKMHSEEIEKRLNENLLKFNKYFSLISYRLYNEKYNLQYSLKNDKGEYYNWNIDASNQSTGKRQGEIIAFDIARILFHNSLKLSIFNFLLNDRKELMDIKQLEVITDIAKEHKIQVIFPMLRDKTNNKILANSHTVVELSQNNKLFKV